MPEEAKKVFEGVIFDVYQWEQELFDGSVTTFEKLRRADTVDVIPITEEGKIVIVEQLQSGWRKPRFTLAGGRMQEGETAEDAAKRELLEETGLIPKEMILWTAVQPTTKIDWAVHVFIAKGCTSIGKLNPDPGEKISIKEIDFNEFIQLATRPGFYDSEITLQLLKAMLEPKEMKAIKKLFLG